MKLVPFVSDNGNRFAVNPNRVDAIKEIASKTRIFVGDFYSDVIAPFDIVFGKINGQIKDDEQDG